MKIFTPKPNSRYANITVFNDSDVHKLTFEGEPLIETWEPVKMRSPFKSKKIVDFMSSSPEELVVSDKALRKLLPLIGPYVEALPLDCDWGDYWVINVLSLVDCIDYERSEYMPIPGGRRLPNGHPVVMLYTKYMFREETIRNIPIFKNADQPRMPIYVSEEFVDLVNRLGLKGHKFELLWDSISK